ncbi:MAG: glycosyltransferase family 2 protein [bacterium]
MSDGSPLVSIIIPTYNREALLRETLGSLFEQTYDHFEILVIDNYSTDATEQFLKNIADQKVKHFKNKNHGVISVNRNFGIKHAQGKYICFCDSDDLWEKEKLAIQVEFMEKHQNIGLCFTDGKFITEKGIIVGNYFKKRVPEKITFDTLLLRNYISTVSVMIRSVILDTVGMFDESRELVGIEDLNFWLRIAKEHSLSYIPEALFKYRMHEGNIMGVDSYQWARKCMMLARYMYKKELFSKAEFIKMYGYNVVKSFYYSLKGI